MEEFIFVIFADPIIPSEYLVIIVYMNNKRAWYSGYFVLTSYVSEIYGKYFILQITWLFAACIWIFTPYALKERKSD